jgi:hypothetical protein
VQADSIEAAEKKIDEMASAGKLDPAFLLTMARAYSGVKETDYTRDEVKDVMYHLYMKAKEAVARDAPKEVRVLKHLLSIEDPAYRLEELEKAFQPVRCPRKISCNRLSQTRLPANVDFVNIFIIYALLWI